MIKFECAHRFLARIHCRRSVQVMFMFVVAILAQNLYESVGLSEHYPMNHFTWYYMVLQALYKSYKKCWFRYKRNWFRYILVVALHRSFESADNLYQKKLRVSCSQIVVRIAYRSSTTECRVKKFGLYLEVMIIESLHISWFISDQNYSAPFCCPWDNLNHDCVRFLIGAVELNLSYWYHD